MNSSVEGTAVFGLISEYRNGRRFVKGNFNETL
jgi:hypothetical protein